ncbi:hypothetical protein ACIRON_02610 [Nocardioides sp. NPDC101246]|uniref:hypothetical protein n=1 Tax=Nocardioides sp. NPDC101246 TaxID=3364336 RepID=UPI003806BD8C
MNTPAASKVPEATWLRLTEFATAVVESPTMAEQLTASQGLLEQATLVRQQLVVAASDKGMPLAEIGRELSMSPEGARKLRLAALKELDR